VICPECQSELLDGSIFCNGCGHKLGAICQKFKNVPFASRKAAAHFNKAIEVAEEIGANGLMVQAFLGLGRLHKAKKRKDKARECLLKAVDCFERCEAETILKQTREVLDSLG
jgi:hypothetical protein